MIWILMLIIFLAGCVAGFQVAMMGVKGSMKQFYLRTPEEFKRYTKDTTLDDFK